MNIENKTALPDYLIDAAATNGDSLHNNNNTSWDEVAAIISGLIGGGRYGLKIRIPHAFVMTFLFGNKLSFRRKLQVIAKLAAEHSINLASFACVYKFLLASLKVLSRLTRQNNDGGSGDGGDASVHHYGIVRQLAKSVMTIIVNGPFSSSPSKLDTTPAGLPQHPYHAFLAGAVGGYIVWGRYSSVNYQLILYLASRILVGCIKLAREKGIRPFSWKRLEFANSYPYGAAVIWGTVMMLFEEYPEVLHPSLRRSMDEIYRFASFGGGSSTSSLNAPAGGAR
eukprot:scaffold7298_cov150-Skeletonema_menzelii.AAC.18